jgi:hypothetical protein
VFRRFTLFAVICALLAGVGLLPQTAAAQDNKNAKPENKSKNTKPENKKAKSENKNPKPENKNITAEAVAEGVIYVYGTRPGLEQIRRNGVERGRITRVNSDGHTEESSYERRFIRGENSAKDKLRIDQKSPTVEYALIYGDGHTWGIINGQSFTPREETTAEFLSQKWHGIDALLRYKEDGSTLTLVGKDKQMGVDMHVLDLTDKENRRTRYYISAKSLRVLALEYEEAPAGGGKPIKYMRKFYDYRAAQSTLVPYRTVLYEDGKQTQETHVMTVTYGVKMEDSIFQNPEAQAATTQP